MMLQIFTIALFFILMVVFSNQYEKVSREFRRLQADRTREKLDMSHFLRIHDYDFDAINNKPVDILRHIHIQRQVADIQKQLWKDRAAYINLLLQRTEKSAMNALAGLGVPEDVHVPFGHWGKDHAKNWDLPLLSSNGVNVSTSDEWQLLEEYCDKANRPECGVE